MKKFKYLKLSKTKRLNLLIITKKNSILFLHGFMSDIEGKKPNPTFAKK